jgi:hypothetical protein
VVRWEYRVVSLPLTEAGSRTQRVQTRSLQAGLNEVGREGWELVSYVEVPEFVMEGDRRGSMHLSFWKRPVE